MIAEDDSLTEADFDISVHGAYIKKFNIYGVENESAIFDTLTLDTATIERQYIVYGAIEGRPYRFCKDTDVNLVPKCETTQADESPNVGFAEHIYCAKDAAVYCLDCEPETSECPDNFVAPISLCRKKAPALLLSRHLLKPQATNPARAKVAKRPTPALARVAKIPNLAKLLPTVPAAKKQPRKVQVQLNKRWEIS